jgi:hypothetical protein
VTAINDKCRTAALATLVAAAAVFAVVLLAALTFANGASASTTGLGGFEPLTPWQQPTLELPPVHPLDYRRLTETGISQAAHWRHGAWYCEYLRCAHGPYPLVTIWGEVPLFESVDALDTASPSAAHRALVDRFARANERYWDSAVGGYAPYPGDRAGNVQTFFDDNGWEGLAFVNAYKATHEHRWLYDAQRAFHFIAARGWDKAGGGMWWNTSHPYHSGPALAADALLGVLLYGEDHERWQLEDAREYVDWANANDNNDERQLYLEKPNQPESVNDYVQAPLIYAQYLLCRDGEGENYCVQAGRVAATLAERHVDAYGYEYNYGPEYDAIFMQWMMAYGQATGEPYWLNLAQVNAAAAATHASAATNANASAAAAATNAIAAVATNASAATNGGGLWLSSWWGGAIADPETHPSMLRTAAATTSLFAWLQVYSAAGS